MLRGTQAGRWGKPLKGKPQERNRVKKTENARSGANRQRSEKLQRWKYRAAGIARSTTLVVAKRTLCDVDAEGEETPREERRRETRYGVPQQIVKSADDNLEGYTPERESGCFAEEQTLRAEAWGSGS